MTTSDQKVETSERELVLTRTFAAPPELVFEAYSSCEHIKNWWGPRSWPVTKCSMDFQVGGTWHYCMQGPDGTEAWSIVTYEEIVPSERIAYRDAFSDEDGTINEALPQTRSSVEFEEADGRTVVTIRAVYPTAADLQTVVDMGMIPGITETLDRLDEHLAERV